MRNVTSERYLFCCDWFASVKQALESLEIDIPEISRSRSLSGAEGKSTTYDDYRLANKRQKQPFMQYGNIMKIIIYNYEKRTIIIIGTISVKTDKTARLYFYKRKLHFKYHDK